MKKSRDSKPKLPDYEFISYERTDEHTLEKVATPHVLFSLTAEKYRRAARRATAARSCAAARNLPPKPALARSIRRNEAQGPV